MTTADWAIIISLGSLLIAFASFVWSVWSKWIYPKARVRVTFNVSFIFDGQMRGKEFLSLNATNFGPSKIKLTQVQVVMRDHLFAEKKYGLLKPLDNILIDENFTAGVFSGGLPKTLEVGENFSSYFVFPHETFKEENVISIGFFDSFNRLHKAPKSHVKKVTACVRDKSAM